jgi:hypothetical protein
MKLFVSAILLFICSVSFSIENTDTLNSKLKAGCTISLNSNGIASIPSFSLDKPAIMASVTLAKGRFSYDPTLAYGLDLRPWFIDNWLHYRIVVKPKFELRTGFNISTFGSKYLLDEGSIHEAQRYFAFELSGTYKLTSKSILSLSYWNDRGQEPGTIKGHFLSIVGERSDIMLGEKVSIAANVMLFYINYTGNEDGLFSSPKISSYVRNIPFSLYFQGTQAIQSNIDPFPGFRWNVGLSYTL